VNSHDLNRRDFLAAGTGLFIFFGSRPLEAQQPAAARAGGPRQYPTDMNAYLRLGPDSRVTCLSGRVELGQANTTMFAQCMAEELDVPYESVDMIMGDTDVCPWDATTMGSRSAPALAPMIRRAGAEAKAVLLQMAAERFGAPVDRLRASAGVITDPSTNRRVTYGQLVEGKRIERHLEDIPVTAPAALRVMARSPLRKDALEKITGKAKFAGDLTLPGMLCARVLRPPAHGATLRYLDTSRAEKAGFLVVREGDFVAVLHERRDLAEQGLGLLIAEYDRPHTGVNDETIFDHIVNVKPEPKSAGGEQGSLAEGEKLAVSVVEQTYLNPYVAHAPTETHAALAHYENGKMTVWAGTQSPFPLRTQVAQAIGTTEDHVRVVTPYVGGAFGGKGMTLQGIEAARLAKIVGRPVQVMWSREEEFYNDNFRPVALMKVRAGLTAAGKIAFWDYQVWGGGDREARTFYDVPHQRTLYYGQYSGQGCPPGMHPFETGPWRGPCVNSNAFAKESHMDMLASKAGMDPVEFRMNNLSDPRMRRVLETVAKQFGWKPAKSPSGRGVGVCCTMYQGSRTTSMAEIEVNRSTGHVQVKRVVFGFDQGLTINPDCMRQQMEGGMTMGMGYAFGEEVRFADGEVFTRSYETYPTPRFSWLPRIETILIDNHDAPAEGGGEGVIVSCGGLYANAVCDAIGVRLTRLPMTPESIRKALGTSA
jgi:nicotinate dehydrogenase subunit B